MNQKKWKHVECTNIEYKESNLEQDLDQAERIMLGKEFILDRYFQLEDMIGDHRKFEQIVRKNMKYTYKLMCSF